MEERKNPNTSTVVKVLGNLHTKLEIRRSRNKNTEVTPKQSYKLFIISNVTRYGSSTKRTIHTRNKNVLIHLLFFPWFGC